MTEFPPIEELIPHRGSMLLLDRVVEFDGEKAVAEYRPLRDAWYADANGNMPAWIGIELMAQTVAVHVTLSKKRDGILPKMGVLLGTRSFCSSLASFDTGRVLRIRVTMVLQDTVSGLGAYQCSIELDDIPLAMAVLKVYEPENFDLFVQGSIS
ncbi:MAG: hotdog family protein [Betaproteobacteria bacterium]